MTYTWSFCLLFSQCFERTYFLCYVTSLEAHFHFLFIYIGRSKLMFLKLQTQHKNQSTPIKFFFELIPITTAIGLKNEPTRHRSLYPKMLKKPVATEIEKREASQRFSCLLVFISQQILVSIFRGLRHMGIPVNERAGRDSKICGRIPHTIDFTTSYIYEKNRWVVQFSRSRKNERWLFFKDISPWYDRF